VDSRRQEYERSLMDSVHAETSGGGQYGDRSLQPGIGFRRFDHPGF
jgi:hypothetical protein